MVQSLKEGMPREYLRKIIQIGQVSKGVTLPASWLRYHNVTRGDLVKVIEDDDKIEIELGEENG